MSPLLFWLTRITQTERLRPKVAVCSDVLPYVQAKKETIRAQRLALELSTLLDTANAPIFEVNCEGKVTIWNKVRGLFVTRTVGRQGRGR